MAPVASAYKHFRECLEKEYTMESGDSVCFQSQLVDLNEVPQCFLYDRVKEMVSA